MGSCLINISEDNTEIGIKQATIRVSADQHTSNYNTSNHNTKTNYTEYTQTDTNHTNILLGKTLIYNMSEIISSTETIRSSSKIFDQDYIYNYLNQQINGAKTYYDLHNLIHHLLPINELKKILSNQLLKLRNIPKYNSKNKLKPMQTETNASSNEKHENNRDRSLLAQLYLQAASLEEIFSDDVLVNIIKFLPSNNYPRIPCISSNFRKIMKKYPSIYRQYTINITLDKLLLHNEGILWIIINHNLRNISIIHRIKNASAKASFIRNDSLSIRRQFEEDVVLNDSNVIKYEIRNIDDISNKVPFLWYCCKKWNIQSIKKIKRRSYFSGTSSAHASSMISYKSLQLKNVDTLKNSGFTMVSMQSGDSYDMDGNNGNNTPRYGPDTPKYEIQINETLTPTTTLLSVDNLNTLQQQNDENNLFVAILNKSCNYICSLYIDNINDKHGSEWYLLNKLKLYKLLNHISIHNSIHNLILESWLNTKIQLQSIKYLDLNNICILNDKLKQIIEYCNHLMVFDCYINNIGRSANDINNISNVNNNEYITVKFPINIQFIRLQFIGDTFKIDLSQCTKLCGLYINDTLTDLQPILNTIESGNTNDGTNNNNNNDDNKCRNTVTIDHIKWPINGHNIECLLLDQAMEDVHNINMAVPLFINEWYNTLKYNNKQIPVRFIRYITHPFIDKNNTQYIDNDYDDETQQQMNNNDNVIIDDIEDNDSDENVLNDMITPMGYDNDYNSDQLEEESNSVGNILEEQMTANYKMLEIIFTQQLIHEMEAQNESIQELVNVYEGNDEINDNGMQYFSYEDPPW